MADIEYPPHNAARQLPFSSAVRVGELLIISGQASTDASGQIVSGTFEEELRQSMENLRTVVQEWGCELSDIVQTRNYVKDPADLTEFNRLYREYFSVPYPARTTLSHCLGRLKFEIDAIAVVRRPS